MTTIRLILAAPEYRRHKPPTFSATLDSGEFVCRSSQPRLDAARELLQRGFPPETMLTSRWAGKSFDNFTPTPIGELAKWLISERDRGGLRKQPYVPFADARGRVKTAPCFPAVVQAP